MTCWLESSTLSLRYGEGLKGQTQNISDPVIVLVFLGATMEVLFCTGVFYAALITFVVTVALTIFAFQTKIDFTAIGGILFVAVVILMVFGIICLFFPGKTMILVYSSLGALLFSVYIVYDTQMMMGGDHKYSISPEEYVFASLNLYMDIVNLFLYILTILGASRD
ncbi:hypothetical protein J6590_049011 [Homalodisca vitripennis]|nr:hypothetical protein J6590_049011 [Homalodisca vitripennis]